MLVSWRTVCRDHTLECLLVQQLGGQAHRLALPCSIVRAWPRPGAPGAGAGQALQGRGEEDAYVDVVTVHSSALPVERCCPGALVERCCLAVPFAVYCPLVPVGTCCPLARTVRYRQTGWFAMCPAGLPGRLVVSACSVLAMRARHTGLIDLGS
jgi:hypothetical protein